MLVRKFCFIKKCNPEKKAIAHRKQVSFGAESNIAKARKGWCRQIGVRFGIWDYYDKVLKTKGLPKKDRFPHIEIAIMPSLEMKNGNLDIQNGNV